jgi:Ca2+-binding RTX toxin-like protein
LVYGSVAQDRGDRFLYNLQSGALLFDRDGTGSATAVLIGTLKNKPRITAADIVVI